ncbi:MAG: LacI family transcriptional regulator [Anaerolineae bacterium]|nr:LacI family transcriptional regulator [Anaerolineae bacterium]
MKTSIKDIARAAGVSHSTVSRALSDSPLVNEVTRSRIHRLALEMGYSPDAGARSLVRGHTCTVGVVVTTIADPFSAEVVEGIEATAYSHGYSVILAASHDEPEREIAAVEMLRSKRVDAVIVTSSRVGALHQERLGAAGVPVILLNSHSLGGAPHTFSVRVDDQHGARLATEHLLMLGHRRLAHVAGPAGHSPSADRLAGYRAALAGVGVPFDPAQVIAGTGRPAAGEQALPQFLAMAARPTAVFCYNDMTAIGLLRAAHSAGLIVPDDLAIAGFDDIPFATYVSPSLTTIAQPKFELGQQAMSMALTLMSGVAEGVSDVVLQGRLVVRESTRIRG